MAIWMLLLAGALRWGAKLQFREGPRRALNWAAFGALCYAAYVLVYEPDRAWEIRWVGRAIARGALAVVNTLIP